MKQFVLSYFPWIVTLLFIGFKIQDLSLPYFWDEAWSYFPALEAMQKTGPSLLPGAIDPQLYRGHPLLFYFLGSTWMNLFPGNIAWAKLFPLLISVALLLKTYDFANTHFNVATARMAMVLLSVQSVFLAQASFLLPEMLLSLCSILALDAFLKQQQWKTIFWVTLALYTKESALVLGLSLIAWQWLNEFAKQHYKINLKPFLSAAHLLLPFAFISVFFVLQKHWIGWVFFPEHIGYISIQAFLDKAEMYLGYLLLFRGRNLLSFASILALILLLFRHAPSLVQHKNKLLGLAFFILSYLAFSSLNFYSPRYLLSVLPLFIILFSFFLWSAFQKNKWLFALLFLLLFGNNCFYSFFRFEPNDHTLGYRDMIATHQEACQWIEKEIAPNQKVATHFLMKANLEQPSIGYLKNNTPYNKVHIIADSTTQFIVVSNIEMESQHQEFLNNHPHQLLKHIAHGNCFTNIYRITK